MSSVSLIIPTHNRAELLARAIRSALAQTCPPGEILVIDDGSTDATGATIARDFPSVRYYRQQNRGVSAARNRGLAEARGEWIALLDSDDEWKPNKLERQLAALAARPHLRVCHTDEIWIRRGRRVNPMNKHAKAGGDIFLRCLARCVVSPSSALIHRDVFDEIGAFDESLPACEDYDLWLRIAARREFLYLDEPLIVKYGGHADQLSRRHWGMDRFRVRALEKIIESGELSESKRAAAIETLLEKLEILAAGAAKRGRPEDAALWRARKSVYPDRAS